MEDIEDLLLNALVLPDKTQSECSAKARALRKAIVKCVIRFNEIANPKSKDFLEEYGLDVDESVAITSVDKICFFADKKSHRVIKYFMKGICLTLNETGNHIRIFPLCKFVSKVQDCVLGHEVSLNDFVQAAYALLCKVYETKD